jgi:glutamine amidotransferase
MLTIIDYEVGNLTSIKNMLERIGVSDVLISGQLEDIATADKLILPGVGHFDYGMAHLRESSFFDVLNKKVLVDKTPILGICLGAQLLLNGSEEGNTPGLGWINGFSTKFRAEQLPPELKIPHMGWNEVKPIKSSKLLQCLPEDPRFYFVHSFHMTCTNPEHHLLGANYGYPFIAGVEKDNILGVQFHPEKSHKYGMALLKNFVTNY